MKLQLIAILIIIGLSAFGQNNFAINGEIEIDEGRLLVLTEKVSGVDTLASSMVRNGRFELKGSVDEAVMALLKLETYDGGFLMVLEPTNNYTAILEKDGLGDIHGGELQDVFNKYRKTVAEGNEEVRAYRKEIAKATKEKRYRTVNRLNNQIEEVVNNTKSKLNNILANYQETVLVAYILTSSLPQDADLELLETIYANMTDFAKETQPGKILAARIAKIKKTTVSAVAPNFTLPTPDGTDFSLYDLKGKIKIIDFWASWCSPCRMENPNMVKLYNDYKDKGLNILSVSLDDRRKPWINAIEKDGMLWTQVSSLEGWNCKVIKLYNIEAVPTILILDENNRIIGKDIRAEKLREFVSKRLD